MKPIAMALCAAFAFTFPLHAADLPCADKPERKSASFLVRIKNFPGADGTKEFRGAYNHCARYADTPGRESWTFGDATRAFGFMTENEVGRGESVFSALFTNQTTFNNLCISVELGRHKDRAIYEHGFSFAQARFVDRCTKSQWTSDVQVIPLAF